MIIRQFFDDFISHSSYLIGSRQSCAIIDPRRDVDIYIDAARSMKLKITHILETHLHADFISGHLDLSDKTDALIFGPEKAGFQFKHTGLADGDTFEIGDIKIKVIETPGHTPEMINYIAFDMTRNKKDPAAVFTGDTLFVGDVGRPDLFPGRRDELTEKLFSSLKNRILKLPDYCEIYPAHGAGSLCGGEISSKRMSTLRFERNNNTILKAKKLDDFKKLLYKKELPVPDHFKRCSDINRNGPKLLKNLPELITVNTAESRDMLKKNRDIFVCDIRSYDAFGGQHIPGSINIDFDGIFGNYSGWVLPSNKNIILVAENPEQAQIAFKVLRRVGLDQKICLLNRGMDGWAINGYETGHTGQLNPGELKDMLENKNGKDTLVLLDVRNTYEFDSGHIKNALNIPVHELRTRFKEIDNKARVIAYCGSGKRSGMGCSILKSHGFDHVYNLAGGINSYISAGYRIQDR